jgi:hypothetical protein
MTLRDQFLALCRLYAEAKDISLGRLSSQMFDDGKKIPAIEAGSDLTTRRFESGVRFLAENWPPELAWPDHTRRPAVEKVAA